MRLNWLKCFTIVIVALTGCASTGTIGLGENGKVLVIYDMQDEFSYKKIGLTAFQNEKYQDANGWPLNARAKKIIQEWVDDSLRSRVDIFSKTELNLGRINATKAWARQHGYSYLVRLSGGNTCVDMNCNHAVNGLGMAVIFDKKELSSPIAYEVYDLLDAGLIISSGTRVFADMNPIDDFDENHFPSEVRQSALCLFDISLKAALNGISLSNDTKSEIGDVELDVSATRHFEKQDCLQSYPYYDVIKAHKTTEDESSKKTRLKRGPTSR